MEVNQAKCTWSTKLLRKKVTWPMKKVMKKQKLGPSDLAHFSVAKMTCQNSYSCLIPHGSHESKMFCNSKLSFISSHFLVKKRCLMKMYIVVRIKLIKFIFSQNKHFELAHFYVQWHVSQFSFLI